PSPDGKKSIDLTYDGEARFGPAFFKGSPKGFSWTLLDSTFGEDVHWSADSRYVVLVLFHSRDTSRSPDVELVAVDTNNGLMKSLDRNRSGLIYPQGFVATGLFRYIVIVSGLEETRECQVA